MSHVQPSSGDTLVAAAVKILLQPEPSIKSAWSHQVAQLWGTGDISNVADGSERRPPDTPARPQTVQLVERWNVPKLGRGGTASSRQAMLHSLVHIEGVAVDLAWDAIARYGARMPREFSDDFVTVAEDEARHFVLLEKRLREIGMHYGDLPAHEGLWESARATANSLAARLAIESCVHEARGLDVLPSTISRFRAGGDPITADLLLQTVLPEEVSHCAAGTKWLTWLFENPTAYKDYSEGTMLETCDGMAASCAANGDEKSCSHNSSDQPLAPPLQPNEYRDVQSWFQALVKANFAGKLKGPFNEAARLQAGFDRSWWHGLDE